MRNALIFLMVLMVLSSCSDSNLAENAKVSGCGGFKDEAFAISFKDETELDAKCDQQIIWKYDEQSGVLTVLNTNIILNCCGNQSIKIEENDGGYDFVMIDKSERGARCNCICLYDYTADIKNISGKSVKLSVYIDIEEEKERQLFWEGDIDLTEKSGTIKVGEINGYPCEDYYEEEPEEEEPEIEQENIPDND
ncbi:MAG TPA: hypothetical protein PLG63_02170 [bacterium]|nr:hypothetical protein [bacterium]